MLRKILIVGGAAFLAGLPFVLSPASPPRMSESEVEAARMVKLCEAGLRPARECAATSESRRAAAQSRSAVGVWADPSSSEQASAAIRARTPVSPDQAPAAPEAIETPAEDAGPTATGSLASTDRTAISPARGRRSASAAKQPEAEVAPRALSNAAPPPLRPAAPPRQAAGPAPRTAAEDKPEGKTTERAAKEAASKALAQSYLGSWSSGGGHDAGDIRSYYSERVNYFGRSVDHQELLSQKRRFAQRWPVRNYRHRPGSLDVRCDESGKHCRVHSIVDYEAVSPERGARANGSVRFELGLDVSGARPVVTSENTRRLASASAARVPASRPLATAARIEAPRRMSRQPLTEEVWLEEIDGLQ